MEADATDSDHVIVADKATSGEGTGGGSVSSSDGGNRVSGSTVSSTTMASTSDAGAAMESAGTSSNMAVVDNVMHRHQGRGRIRLPDKLMEYLNKEVLPDTLWWQPDGDCFVFHAEKIQATFLHKHFRGTKLTSFIRSLNRWYGSPGASCSCALGLVLLTSFLPS